MSAFPSSLIGLAAPIPRRGNLADNIDTDTIIPSREMRSTGRTGLADGLFAPWRYRDADTRIPNPQFSLNQPEFASAQILAGGANFGAGSSREHAVWALAEFGIKAIIAESFAPIFQNNCLRNFLLPIALPRDAVEACASQAVTITLEQQSVQCRGDTFTFDIDPEAKHMLAQGLDPIDLTLTQNTDITAWLSADRGARPWVYLETHS
jgi:3-isopropylmalate/(R)-2-methylmalate dehydratase small subunit